MSAYRPSGDSRYNKERDRSPFRSNERRGSISGGRNQDNSYRPGDSYSNSRDFSSTPRGPGLGRGGQSYAPRGRGYAGRDSRDSRGYSRDNDRDFGRRDSERRRSSSRTRSRTPPRTSDYRDIRESRDRASLRSLDTSRISRESGAPLSSISISSDSGFGRGRFKGTDRNDWTPSSSRRFDDRARSKSRDRYDSYQGDRRRDIRDRDYDKEPRREDDRDNDYDRRRDPPTRPASRNSVISQTASAGHPDRREPPRQPVETPRRSSFAQSASRPDVIRAASSAQPPPSPSYPQGPPAFGAFAANSTTETPRTVPAQSPKHEISPGVRSDNADPTKIAPKGPKADLAVQPPTAPKAFPQRRPPFADQSPAARRFESGADSSTQSPSVARFGPSTSPQFPGAASGRLRNPTWTSPELTTRPGPPSSHESRQITDRDSMSRPADIKIPTGPKAARDSSLQTPISARTGRPPNNIWVNPNLHQRTQPSIMGSMHHKKDNDHISRPMASSPIRDARPGSRSSNLGQPSLKRLSTDMTSARRMTTSPRATPSAIQGLRHKAEDEDDEEDAVEEDDEDDEDDDDGDEEAEEEDMDDLTEEDFERAEARYEREIESHKSDLGPSLDSNPKILSALETIEVYAAALAQLDDNHGPLISSPKTETKIEPSATPQIASPTLNVKPAPIQTPPAEPVEVKEEEEVVTESKPLILDISLDGLSYLQPDVLTPATYDYSDDDLGEDDLCEQIRHKMGFLSEEEQELQAEYTAMYRQWREQADEMEEDARRQAALITRAATPLSAVGTETAGTPVPDAGRRSTRNATEIDFERALKASAEEAEAAQQIQAAVDMSVDPDWFREAECPEMLEEEDQDAFEFADHNNFISSASDAIPQGIPENPVLGVFDYKPFEDDFDTIDQEHFADAYSQHPKQWGAIADAMNSLMLAAPESIAEGKAKSSSSRFRNYHECIFHYYTTKKQSKPAYKTLPGRKKPKKRAAKKGSNKASILGNSEEAAVRISDSGRPKRFAAPTFNEQQKKEQELLAQKAAAKEKKSSSLLNKPTPIDGVPAPEKTPAKRSRKKDGEATTTRKRGAKPATAIAPNPTAPKTAEVDAGGDIHMLDAFRSRTEAEAAQALAGLFNTGGIPVQQPQAALRVGSQNETWRIDPRVQAPQNLSSSVAPQQPLPAGWSGGLNPELSQSVMAQNEFRQHSPGMLTSMSGNARGQPSVEDRGGTSSYWSVQEAAVFKSLLGQVGTNWSLIQSRLPMKTELMIKNFFVKGGRDNKGESKEAAELAKADLMRIAEEANKRISEHGPPKILDLPAQPINDGTRPNIRRGTRAIAPNLDMIADIVAPSIESRLPTQESPQDRAHPRLLPAQRQQMIPGSTESQNAARVGISPQTMRTQTGITQSQMPPVTYPTLMDDRSRAVPPPATRDVAGSKRPRSFAEQDRHVQDQPPKRQGLQLEDFSHQLAQQHEIQQHQQRAMYRSDSQQGFPTRSGPPISQPVYPAGTRIVSNPEEVDPYRARPASPAGYRRDSFTVPQYSQIAASHPGSMASVMGGARGMISSPGQRLPAELPRPTSVTSVNTPSSSRPTPAPAQKRSNIMSLLNDDPPEEKRPEPRPAVIQPPVRHESPMGIAPMYQAQASYQRREVVDPIRDGHAQRGFAPQAAYAPPTTQGQNYPAQSQQYAQHPLQHQQQSTAREAYPTQRYYIDPPRSHEPARPLYQQQPAATSPPAQQTTYNMARPGYETAPYTAAAPSNHSRAASYGQHPNQAAASGPAPSPYSTIRPTNVPRRSYGEEVEMGRNPPMWNQHGPPTMSGTSRAVQAHPQQLVHDQRRVDDRQQPVGYTPSGSPANASSYRYQPPPPQQ